MACAFSSGTCSCCWLANSRSCSSQYLPCSPAQCAASAALGACSWFGSGKSLNTSRILPRVLLLELDERRGDAGAERALVLGELDDGDRCIGRPDATDRGRRSPPRCAAVEGDFTAGPAALSSPTRMARFCSSRVRVMKVGDRRAQVGHGRRADAVAVVVVDLLDLGVGDRHAPLRQLVGDELLLRDAELLGGIFEEEVPDELVDALAAVLVEELGDAGALARIVLLPAGLDVGHA